MNFKTSFRVACQGVSVKLLVIVSLLLLGAGLVRSASVDAAACAPTADNGTVTSTISVTTAGTYRVWSRILAPDTTNNSYYLEIGGNCITVGDSAITANTWTWVDYQNGTNTNKINVTLTTGSHTIKLIGKEPGVKLDRLLLLSDAACVPTGTGGNCTISGDTTAPTVSLTAPTAGATVTGTTSLSANASDNIGVTKIEFLVDGTVVNTSPANPTSPYSFSWNSTSVSNGNHSLTAKAYDLANNVTTSSAVTVNVNNQAAGQADLIVTALTWTPASPANGNAVTFSATIKNQGTAATPDGVIHGVVFTVDGTAVAWSDNSQATLAPGASRTVTANGGPSGSATWTATAGTHDVKANVDDINRITESNESNNIFTANPPLSVGTPPPSDTIAPTVNITAPIANATVTGTTNVTASATDNVGVTKVEFLVDGILRSTDTASPYAFSWNTTTVSNGSHSLTAKAYDAIGNSATNSVTVTVQNGDTQAPSVPANVAASAAAFNRVNLTWTASTDNVGVTGYYVVRNGVTIAQLGAVTSYADTSVNASTSYNYQVMAFDAAGNVSALSSQANVTTPAAPDTQAPTAPANLAASAVSTSQINLTWSASTDNVGVTGYDVYRNSTKIASVTTTSFGDTGLSASTSYSYYAVARDAAGNISTASNTASATTQTPPPPTTSGTLTGVVSSSSGPLAGAKVEIRFNGGKRSFTTNSVGSYFISNIPPGSYEMKFSAKGYTAQTATVSVSANTTTTKNITLQRR